MEIRKQLEIIIGVRNLHLIDVIVTLSRRVIKRFRYTLHKINMLLFQKLNTLEYPLQLIE